MFERRRAFIRAGISSLAGLGSLAFASTRQGRAAVAAAVDADCLDYGMSFICNKARFNSVRFWIESRTTVTDSQSGGSTTFYQCGSCKSENTFAERDLFVPDNYDFLPILGDGEWLIFRRPVRLSDSYRRVQAIDQVWGEPVPMLGNARTAALASGGRIGVRGPLREGEAPVVLGPRSAVFAPLPDLGLVVVDEEQDPAYKQETTPRYSGRDLALVRGRDAGATVVPINVLAAAPEVAYFLRDASAKLLVAHPLFAAVGQAGAAEAGVECLVSSGEGDTLVGLAHGPECDDVALTESTATAVILYTSGTTGKPKGAELTHSNLFLNCAFVAPRLFPMQRGEMNALATLPLFHSFGQQCIMNASIAMGGSFSLLPRFEPGAAFEIIERDRINVFAGVPTMYFGLLHHEGGERFDVSSLRFCLTGGAPMPVEVLHEFEKRFGIPVQEGFGLSETSPVASFNVVDKPRKPGSIGYPVWGVEMCIMDDEGRQLPDGERGEICIRGHNVMKGYLGRPEATAESIRDGWFHSGDIGYRDEDGCYFIVDRKKDMILRGGFNVYPREVEEVLYAHPAVAEAAVIGVPHPTHGEEVKAFVAFAPGQSASEDEIVAWCKERLAAYKYPRIVRVIAEIPKGPSGKLLKRELRDLD